MLNRLNPVTIVAGDTGELEPTDVAVASLTTIGEAIDVSHYGSIKVDITNGDNAFDAFSIQGSADGSNYDVLYDASVDFTSPSGILIGTSGNLTALAAATRGWFILDCSSLSSLKVQASANTTISAGVAGAWSAK